jgi:transcriptional regulator with XRE-family HTH domain
METDDILNEMVNFIFEERNRQGLSQDKLSILMVGSLKKQKHISSIENKERPGVEFVTIVKILKALGFEITLKRVKKKQKKYRVLHVEED